MNKNGDLEALAAGLRALAVLADNAPLDIAGFAKLSGLTEDEARQLMHTYENCGYARRTQGHEIYVLTQLARDLVGQAAPDSRLH